MHIAYAIGFFVFIGLCETLRHGVFGLTTWETSGIVNGVLVLLAVVILRSDLIGMLRPPRNWLYGNRRLIWSWERTALAVVLGPLLWVVPALYGYAVAGVAVELRPVPAETVMELLAVQVLLVALAEEVFFREAAVKAFGTSIAAIYLVSVLSVFIFHMPQGAPAALIAAGAGMFYVTLRLVGINILMVALVHGATNVILSDVVVVGLTTADTWPYAGYFFAASALLSFATFHLFAIKPSRSKFQYA